MYTILHIDKWVRLHEWEFNLKFEGKVCKGAELNCQHVALVASKTNKHEIKDCNFTLTIANEEAINGFTGPKAGFINRLGKRNLVVSPFLYRQTQNMLQKSTMLSSSS